MIGEQIGSYRITGVLGEGGMGVVYLAEHPVIGQKAAVKVLHPKLTGDRDEVARFFNEARAAALVKHPGIVNVFDVGLHPLTGAAYIVMELLDGEPLSRRLDRQQRLPEEETLRLARQMAGALAAAHKQGIVHRDLKPENVFIVPDAEAAGGERVKILDFGVAKLSGHQGMGSVRTRTGHVVGSPAYMAPEQCKGGSGGAIDGRADVYALGCVILEMISGAPPFLGEGVGDVLAQKLYKDPPRALARVPTMAPALAAIIDRALARSPAARFASMDEMARALSDAAAEAGLRVSVNEAGGPPAPPPAAPRARPRRLLWILLAAAILFVAGGLTALLARGQSAPPEVSPPPR